MKLMHTKTHLQSHLKKNKAMNKHYIRKRLYHIAGFRFNWHAFLQSLQIKTVP